MRLKTIEAMLVDALSRPLPGVSAQLHMAPRPRIGWDPHVFPPGLRDGAALVLLYPIDDDPHVLLTVRGAGLRKHTGQVSFPGGAVDTDESMEAAALREAVEEVGVQSEAVRVVGSLTPLHIPVSGYLLHPIVGVADTRPQFQIAEREVARLLEVPLRVLQSPDLVRHETQTRHRDGQTYDVTVPYFAIEGTKVWGATAMALAELLAICSKDV